MGGAHRLVLQQEVKEADFVLGQVVLFALGIDVEERDDFGRHVPVIDHAHPTALSPTGGSPANLAQAFAAWNNGSGSRVAGKMDLEVGITVLSEVAHHA